MDNFVKSIRKKYQERLINLEIQWPPCHSNKLIRLELVEQERGENSFTDKQRGREDRSLKRTPLAYRDIFKVEHQKKPVRKVLLEGDAGIGKTTLCISISEDWANGRLFQQFELLILLPLRQKEVALAGSLPELLKLLHSSSTICHSVASYLEEEEGKRVVIIADGWDELGESERLEGSFIYNFLFRMFPFMAVVLTSRPSASASLRRLPYIDRFIEVCGFSEENIIEYIKSEFAGDQKKAFHLMEQLESNPLVESVCSIPLNCAIICHLWRTHEEVLPTTMTELYTKIILNVILRNIQKHHAYKSILSLLSFNSLPEGLQQSWWLLCEFAFQTIENDQIVFHQEELVNFFPQGLALDENVYCFGLLQKTESIFEVGCGVSFHFLHLTFQEYLAALHLARQITTDPNPPTVEEYTLRSFDESRRFAIVWRFLFGIYFNLFRCNDCCGILPYVPYNIDRLLLCHCAFEAKNADIDTEVVHLLKEGYADLNFSYPSTAHDCAAMLYVITNMDEGSGISMYLKNSGIRDDQIRALTDILVNKHGKLQIEWLDLSSNKLTDSSITNLFCNASNAFQSLKWLFLGGNRIGEESIKSIITSLAKQSFTALSTLDLSYISLRVSYLQDAIRSGSLSTLKQLSLQGSLTSSASTNSALLATLVEGPSSHCPNLNILVLSENNLGASGGSALARVISHHNKLKLELGLQQDWLKVINLNETKLGDEGLCSFVKELETPHFISGLHLKGNDIHSSGISCLVDAVCTGKLIIQKSWSSEYPGGDNGSTMQQLVLNDNPLQLEGTTAICRMLNYSVHFQPRTLHLTRCQLTSPTSSISHRCSYDNVYDLFQNNFITSLILDGNNFNGVDVHILVSFVYLCPSLERLYSSDCSITSDDLKLLLDRLSLLKSFSPRVCRLLNYWDLSDNEINDSGLVALTEKQSGLFPCMYNFILKGSRVVRLDGNPCTEMKRKLKEEAERLEEVRFCCVILVLIC